MCIVLVVSSRFDKQESRDFGKFSCHGVVCSFNSKMRGRRGRGRGRGGNNGRGALNQAGHKRKSEDTASTDGSEAKKKDVREADDANRTDRQESLGVFFETAGTYFTFIVWFYSMCNLLTQVLCCWYLIMPPPSKKRGHIALCMSVSNLFIFNQ